MDNFLFYRVATFVGINDGSLLFVIDFSEEVNACIRIFEEVLVLRCVATVPLIRDQKYTLGFTIGQNVHSPFKLVSIDGLELVTMRFNNESTD